MDGIYCQQCRRFNPVHESVYGYGERTISKCPHCGYYRWEWVSDPLTEKNLVTEHKEETQKVDIDVL